MRSNPPAVALFSTEKGIGGMQVLVVRMARELHALAVQCVVFDSAGEFVTEELRKSNLPCIQLPKVGGRTTIDTFLSSGCVLIAFNTQPRIIAQSLRQTTWRLLIWDIFPPYWLNGYLKPDIPFVRGWIERSRWLSLARKRHATGLMERSGVTFMDESGVMNMQILTQRQWPDAEVVPVPIESASLPRKVRDLGTSSISCFYMSRAVLWKVKPLKRLLQDFACDRALRWTVITDSTSRLRSLLGQKLADNVTVRENIVGAELTALLLRDADIFFGMGISCLEGARLGIASVLLDFVDDDQQMPPEYGYRWLYDEPGHCLGRDVGGLTSVPGMTADTIISHYRANGVILGRMCWEVVRDKFGPSSVARKLLCAARRTQLTVAGYTKAPIYKLMQLGWLVQQVRSTWKARRYSAG